jgi:DNA-binding NarL/FixJ family response regulator
VETLKRLMELRPDSKIIMMTAYAVEDRVREALDMGAKGVFYKPLDMDQLIARIEEIRNAPPAS